MNNKNNIIGILFLIIIGLFVYDIITTKQIKTDIEKYQTSIDSIQTKIDSVSILNKELDNKLAELDTNILEITQEIQLVDNLNKTSFTHSSRMALFDAFKKSTKSIFK